MRRGSKWLVLPVTGLFLFGVFSGPESRTWAMDAAAAARETGAEVDEPPETGQVPDTMDTTGEIVVDEPDGMFDAVEAALSGDGLSGIGDIETQERTLLLYLEQVDTELEVLREHRQERCRLYTSLGVMGGLFLAVILV